MASQKKAIHISDSLLVATHPNGKISLLFFLISFLLHGLFFGLFIYVQEFRPPKPLPPVIQIDLVSFSPEPVLAESPPQEPEKSNTEGFVENPVITKKAPPKIEHKQPDISLKTKPKDLRKLVEKKKKEKEKPVKKKPKKEEVKKKEPEKEPVKSVEKEPKKKVVDEDQQRIAEALRRLEENLKKPGQEKETIGNEGAHSGYGRKGSRPIDLYNVVIGSTIEQNWVFNDVLAKMDQDLEVRILIKILRSGEIRDIIYETRSGNRYLDESAKKAIKKANPLPALPPGFSSYDVGLIFTPQGLK